ncbi:hypothetical protein ACFYUY_23940 [Kitasatospora sp. NPDC004745]|uniref:hypothetical protein n=1 Tax=Kitasatospora sp. NPDC004745 TaxID=3364019 RepID=UPI0036865294
MSSLYDFETREPLLRTAHARALAVPGGQVSGHIGRGSYSVPVKRGFPPPGQAMLLSDNQEEHDAIERARDTLAGAGVSDIAFTVEIPPNGAAVLRLFDRSTAVDPSIGSGVGVRAGTARPPQGAGRTARGVPVAPGLVRGSASVAAARVGGRLSQVRGGGGGVVRLPGRRSCTTVVGRSPRCGSDGS